MDYAACCFRLGNLDKGIHTLEQQFRKTETGLIYQTLGYLYVEKYDRPTSRISRERKAENRKSRRMHGRRRRLPGKKARKSPRRAEPKLKRRFPEEAWDAGRGKGGGVHPQVRGV